MFKPSPPLFRRLRRLALTTKMVNGGYYKGTGSGSMGRHTKHGGYIIEWEKVRNYMVPPNLAEFKVRLPRSYYICTENHPAKNKAQTELETKQRLTARVAVDAVCDQEDETHAWAVRGRPQGRVESGEVSGAVEDGEWG